MNFDVLMQTVDNVTDHALLLSKSINSSSDSAMVWAEVAKALAIAALAQAIKDTGVLARG
jgi:hypothetical protein